MDLNWLVKEALLAIKKNLKRTPVGIVDMPTDRYVSKVFSVSIKLEKGGKPLNKTDEEIKNEIIIPACFQLANEINKLDKKFNTFVRMEPAPSKTNWVRTELSGIGITIIKAYSIEWQCDILDVLVGIKENG